MGSWLNPCCWFGYCKEAKYDKWASTAEFITESCSILTLLIVFRILAKLEYAFPLHQVADDGVGTGDSSSPLSPDDDDDGNGPPPPPNTPAAGLGTWINPVAANVLADLILHQFPRRDEAPAGIGPLQLETVMRILDLSYKVEFDAELDVVLCQRDKVLAVGSKACLQYVKKLALEQGSAEGIRTERNLGWEILVPAQFVLSLLKGEFPALVNVYKKGYWKGGEEFRCEDLEDPYEQEVAGRFEKAKLLREIETCLEALNASLGDKTFLIGNQLTDVDGVAFGILAQFYWAHDQQLRHLIWKFPGLIAHTTDLHQRLWKDWIPDATQAQNSLSPVFASCNGSNISRKSKVRNSANNEGSKVTLDLYKVHQSHDENLQLTQTYVLINSSQRSIFQ